MLYCIFLIFPLTAYSMVSGLEYANAFPDKEYFSSLELKHENDNFSNDDRKNQIREINTKSLTFAKKINDLSYFALILPHRELKASTFIYGDEPSASKNLQKTMISNMTILYKMRSREIENRGDIFSDTEFRITPPFLRPVGSLKTDDLSSTSGRVSLLKTLSTIYDHWEAKLEGEFLYNSKSRARFNKSSYEQSEFFFIRSELTLQCNLSENYNAFISSGILLLSDIVYRNNDLDTSTTIQNGTISLFSIGGNYVINDGLIKASLSIDKNDYLFFSDDYQLKGDRTQRIYSLSYTYSFN